MKARSKRFAITAVDRGTSAKTTYFVSADDRDAARQRATEYGLSTVAVRPRWVYVLRYVGRLALLGAVLLAVIGVGAYLFLRLARVMRF